jgi:hypothetical protein
MQYEPVWIEARANGAMGVSKCGVLKAFIYANGLVFWELRRLIACMGFNVGDLNDFVKANFDDWEADWKNEGLGVDFRYSARASEYNDRIRDEYTRQEHTLVTKATLLVLVRATKHRKLVNERDMALAFLKQWIYACHVHADETDRAALRQVLAYVPNGTCQLCGSPPVNGGLCIHVQHWHHFCKRTLQARRDEPCEYAIAIFLEKLNGWKGDCAALQVHFSNCLGAVSYAVDQHMDASPFICDDPLKIDQLSGKKKKRRMDEDLRDHLARGVRDGRAPCTAALARALGVANTSTVRDNEVKSLQYYQACGHRLLACPSTVWDSTDAARLGQPALDMQSGLLWGVGIGALVLAPMVGVACFWLARSTCIRYQIPCRANILF